MTRRIAIALAALVTTVALAGTAHAEHAPRRSARAHKRAVPDYDGRGPEPTTVADGLLWIPRAVLLPVRAVVDFGVRRPLGALVRAAEASRTLRQVVRFVFLQPKTPTPQVIPVVFYDFGFQPSIGLRIPWTDGFATPGSKLSLKLGVGGADWWRVDAATRIELGRGFVGVEGGARRRPDHVYYGEGPDAPDVARARYGARRAGMKVSLGAHLPYGEVTAFAATSALAFRSSDYAGDPTIETQVERGAIAALPAGYADGYATVRAGGTIALDSRSHPRARESGARLDATVEQVWDASDEARTWTRVDATLGASLALDPVVERQLDLKLRYQRVDAAMAVEIPFLELASVGGARDLRGFPGGRLYGASAITLTADYQWPLAAWLDAHAHVGAGNVFDRDLSGLHAGALRGSAGLGLSIAGLSDERQVELSTAIATEPLGQGVNVSSFRLVLGFAHDY